MLGATILLSLLANIFFNTSPRNNESVSGQIHLVSLFDNQTLGLEVTFSNERDIYYLESVLDKPPSYYLVGWLPHLGRIMKIKLNASSDMVFSDSSDSVAYSIFESSTGPSLREQSLRSSGPSLREQSLRSSGLANSDLLGIPQNSEISINQRNIPSNQVIRLNQTRTINDTDYQNLMPKIYQQPYFSTINFIGFSANNWVKCLFYDNETNCKVSQYGFFTVNLLDPIIGLCAMLLDALFYYFPFGLWKLGRHFIFGMSLIGGGCYLMVRDFHVILNLNYYSYYLVWVFLLVIVYYFVLSLCFD